MGTIASDSGNAFEPTPMGMQQGVCVFVNDIGIQESEYAGKKLKRHQVILSWELAEKMSDGRPFMVSKWYTLSLNEKATLRHHLESWRGKAFSEEELKGFDLDVLVGVNCLLNLVANENGKAKIASVNPLPKNMPNIHRTALEMSDKFKQFIQTQKDKAIPQTLDDSHNQENKDPESDSGLPF